MKDFGISEIFLFAIIIIICLSAIAFWVKMFILCMQNDKISMKSKLGWAAFLLFAQFGGALIYYFLKESRFLKKGNGFSGFRDDP